jgi:hypothetical protein
LIDFPGPYSKLTKTAGISSVGLNGKNKVEFSGASTFVSRYV